MTTQGTSGPRHGVFCTASSKQPFRLNFTWRCRVIKSHRFHLPRHVVHKGNCNKIAPVYHEPPPCACRHTTFIISASFIKTIKRTFFSLVTFPSVASRNPQTISPSHYIGQLLTWPAPCLATDPDCEQSEVLSVGGHKCPPYPWAPLGDGMRPESRPADARPDSSHLTTTADRRRGREFSARPGK